MASPTLAPLIAAVQTAVNNIQPVLTTLANDDNTLASAQAAVTAATTQLASDSAGLPALASALATSVDALNAAVNPPAAS